jgi:hypothetical protein
MAAITSAEGTPTAGAADGSTSGPAVAGAGVPTSTAHAAAAMHLRAILFTWLLEGSTVSG